MPVVGRVGEDAEITSHALSNRGADLGSCAWSSRALSSRWLEEVG
jgi:hypothetical protein